MLDKVSPPKPSDPPWRSRHAHRSCDPRAASLLRTYREARGWTVSEAAKQTGVSWRMVGMLEAAQRRPSESLRARRPMRLAPLPSMRPRPRRVLAGEWWADRISWPVPG